MNIWEPFVSFVLYPWKNRDVIMQILHYNIINGTSVLSNRDYMSFHIEIKCYLMQFNWHREQIYKLPLVHLY